MGDINYAVFELKHNATTWTQRSFWVDKEEAFGILKGIEEREPLALLKVFMKVEP